MEDISRGIYRHYKGGTVSVIGVAKCSDGKNFFVMYLGNQDGKLYARPFTDFVDYVTNAEGKQVHRFDLVEAKEFDLKTTIDQAFTNGTKNTKSDLQ